MFATLSGNMQPPSHFPLFFLYLSCFFFLFTWQMFAALFQQHETSSAAAAGALNAPCHAPPPPPPPEDRALSQLWRALEDKWEDVRCLFFLFFLEEKKNVGCPFFYTPVCVLMLLYMCPHDAIYVSSCCNICVLMLVYICPQLLQGTLVSRARASTSAAGIYICEHNRSRYI
jgi:hypothetical protein